MSLKARFASRFASLDADDPTALALRLTAVELLLRPMGPGWILVPLLAVAVLALLATPVLLSAWTWYAAAALVAMRIVADWPLPDNHIYLLGYWCLAIALALGSPQRRERLTGSTRLLLGLAFAFAVLWKAVLSPDYRDGRFFTVTLLSDPRFAEVTQLVGRMSADTLASNRRVLAPLPEGAELADPEPLTLTPSFGALVGAATWGALLLETLVAAAFLLGSGPGLQRAQHGLLLAFCLVTYAFAPVAGFGWLLLAMGCSLCRPGQPLMCATYVAAWLAVLFYAEINWASPLLQWMSP
jgi:hypothetical protein